MAIFQKIHDMKVAEYRQQYKWYAHADPEIRDKIIVRNFHMTKSQYEDFCNFMHGSFITYIQKSLVDVFMQIVTPKIGGK